MDYVTYHILKHYNGLSERERFVVENRSQNTLKSLGEQIGVTPERVRQIEAKAYRKMIGRYLYFLQHEVEFREYLDIKKIAEAKKISLERQVEKSIGIIEGENILIDRLPFDTRTKNALKKRGYYTEASLIDQYYKDPEEIADIRNIGEKSYKTIIDYLAERVETIKQNSTKAGEHQTPKPNGTVDKTHDSNRLTQQSGVNKDLLNKFETIWGYLDYVCKKYQVSNINGVDMNRLSEEVEEYLSSNERGEE